MQFASPEIYRYIIHRHRLPNDIAGARTLVVVSHTILLLASFDHIYLASLVLLRVFQVRKYHDGWRLN